MDQRERTAVLGLLLAALALCLCAWALLAEAQRRELVVGRIVSLARYRELRGLRTKDAGGADPAGVDYAWDGETA